MKNDFKEILKIIFTGLFLGSIFLIINYFNGNKHDNSELLKKYTYSPSEEYSRVFNIEYKIIDIHQKNYENLFDAGYIKFKNIKDDYSFVRGKDENLMLDMNIYKSSTGPDLSVWLVDDIYNNISENDFPDLTSDEFKAKYPDVDINDVFKRNKIQNKMDLIHAVVKNRDIEVNEKSSKNQIIDKFTFDYFLPLVIPYDENSELNKIILFTGNQYGYVYIKNDTNYITLKKDKQEVRIIYQDEESKKITINEEQLIELISSIKY